MLEGACFRTTKLEDLWGQPMTLRLISDGVAGAAGSLQSSGGMLAYPHHWQVPAATEKAAYEELKRASDSLFFAYIGFPWATLIDGLRNDGSLVGELLHSLDKIRRRLDGLKSFSRRATVAQHIHADKFIEFFQVCGVTDLFWPHARVRNGEIGGIKIHPFPLFPAQTPDGAEVGDLHRPRPWLANFIGAYNPKVYLTDVRKHIFDDAGVSDLLILKRDAWHFDRAVYEQQVAGIAPDDARLALEERYKTEYLDAIRQSTFTLCPTGSGPNSIRIGESLALGSIPIILTRDLALPCHQDLWEAACLFEDDSADGYRRSLDQARSMSEAELRSRQLAGQALFEKIRPRAYRDLITASMEAASIC